MQFIVAVVAIPPAVTVAPVAGRTAAWVVADIDTAAHLPGKCQGSAEVVDTLAGMVVGTVGTAVVVAGIAEGAVDLP